MDLTFDLFQVELENVTSNISSAGLARDEGVCRVQADGGDTEGIFYTAAYCADVISKVVRELSTDHLMVMTQQLNLR